MMKNLFVTLSFLTTFLTFSQTIQDSIIHPGDSVTQAYQNTMDDIFENVDFSYVPSGIV